MKFTPNMDSINILDTQHLPIEKRLKSMARPPFTEKRLKELGSSLGLKNELKFSLCFHQEGVPLLVSPLLLRSRGLGQIDLGRFIKTGQDWEIELAEVKSSHLGKEVMSLKQKQRLRASGNFLGSLFGAFVRFVELQERETK